MSIIKVNIIKVIHLAGVLSRPFSYGLVYVSTTGLTAGIGFKSSMRFFYFHVVVPRERRSSFNSVHAQPKIVITKIG